MCLLKFLKTCVEICFLNFFRKNVNRYQPLDQEDLDPLIITNKPETHIIVLDYFSG